MKLSIVVKDNSIYKNGVYKCLELGSFNIPAGVRAFQWHGEAGDIEFFDKSMFNQNVLELPEWARAVAEQFDIHEDGQPSDTEEEMARKMRVFRNFALLQCDWTQLPENVRRLTEEQQAAWAEYRQALRDIPAQDGFPFSVAFPTNPDGAKIEPRL